MSYHFLCKRGIRPARTEQFLVIQVVNSSWQIRVNLHGVLHDPAYWSDPEVFRPERFLDADGKVCKNERLVPFGMGMYCSVWYPYIRYIVIL